MRKATQFICEEGEKVDKQECEWPPLKISGHRHVYLVGTALVMESKKVVSSTPIAIPLGVVESASVVSIYSTKLWQQIACSLFEPTKTSIASIDLPRRSGSNVLTKKKDLPTYAIIWNVVAVL